MIQAIRLGEFRREDLQAVKRLIHETIDISYRGVYPEEAVEFFKDYHCAEHILSDAQEGYTLVLEYKGKMVGTGTLLGTNIRRVFIAPAFQGKGLGKAIMHALEERALANRIDKTDLEASLVSDLFYKSLGYVIKREDYVPVGNSQKLVYYAMSKKLDNSAEPEALAAHCMEDIDGEFLSRLQLGDIGILWWYGNE